MEVIRLVADIMQLSDFQKAERLFQMPALGGRKPSELMAAMLETCLRGEEKTNLFACIFLQPLPREIRVLLARADHKDLKTLATQADELWALHNNTNGGGISAVQENPEADFVAAISGDRRRGGGTARGKTRGGGGGRGGKRIPKLPEPEAGSWTLHQALAVRRLRLFLGGPLQLAGKWWCRGKLNAVVPRDLLHLTSNISCRRFLVDTGASFSIFPHQSSDPGSSPALRSPSGEAIPSWGEKKMTVEFSGRRLEWTFLLAKVNFAILGADFLKHLI